jgi:hypothetical protein
MSDLSVAAWTILKRFFVFSLLSLITFRIRQTIYTSVHTIRNQIHQTTTNNPTMDPHSRSIHEIYHTVFLLQQKLVRDVIPTILEYAELYECTSTQTNFNHILKISQHQSPGKLLVCEIPKPLARVLRPVRKIVFKITSHDQGFASDPNGGNWTWFTARKLTESSTHEAAIDESSHKEVRRNAMASSRWTTHEIEWRADSEDSDLAEWVSSLQAGEAFTVDAWARFPGWVNHVREVEVSVYTVAVA